MTAFLRALADRRGLAPGPDCRWPYEPPAVVDSFEFVDDDLAAARRRWAWAKLPAAEWFRRQRRRPCA